MYKIEPSACGGYTDLYMIVDPVTEKTHDVIRVFGDHTAQLVDADKLEQLSRAELVALVRRLMICHEVDRIMAEGSGESW